MFATGKLSEWPETANGKVVANVAFWANTLMRATCWVEAFDRRRLRRVWKALFSGT